MKTYVSQLIFEVTRRCNMHCAHCLRGNAQNLDMTNKIMNQTLDSIENICSVGFTGGEPTLNLAIMDHFLDEIDRRETCISNFEIVTNGKEHQLELATWCLKALPKCAEPEMCYLSMSRDIYHDPVSTNLFKAFTFYSDDKEFKTAEERNRALIAEGRAAKIDGARQRDIAAPEIDFDGQNFNVGMLYVAASGDILFDCDMSFDHADQRTFGNILKESLTDILLRALNEKQEVQKGA